MITLNNNNDSRTYIFGGWNGTVAPLDIVYTFDTPNNMWTSKASMKQRLWHHKAVAMDNTTAMVCGGMANYSYTSAQSPCYTYAILMCVGLCFNGGRWGMFWEKWGLILKSWKICVICDCEVVPHESYIWYQISTDRWSQAAQMNTARYAFGMATYKGTYL
jgi:hypothetical protein